MKLILTILIMVFTSQIVYSQKVFIYGEKGEKIYLQEKDSLIQIRFSKNAGLGEQLGILKSIDPETKFSGTKKGHIIIPTQKSNLPDFVRLNKNKLVIYTNKSLISDDGTVVFPTEKVLVKVKSPILIEQILPYLNVEFESISRFGSDKQSFMIELKNGESVRIANLLYESGYFEYAQPSFTRLIKMQNEFYPNQWGLNNTGQKGGTVGVDINTPEAWAITRGSNNIRVAVIDQGVDLDHPDLVGNLVPGFDATDGGDGGLNGDCWGNDAHGTCCAGIIGAINNTIGTIGVAHQCRVIPIRVSYSRNRYEIWNDDWVVNAIHHAWYDDNADVLSCSWRYNNVAAINTEINNALTLGRNNLGCIVVFAAGNFNSSISYPANSNPDIIAVGAMSPCGQRKRSSSNWLEVNPGVSTDSQGVSCDNEKWWGSNYGSQLDFVAPGVFVPTTDIQGTASYNTSDGVAGNYYQTFNGTSAATPHVAGVAALILSINPGLTQNQVRDIIESTCTKVGNYNYSTVTGRPNGTWNNEMGYGLVNAYAAVKAIYPTLSGPSTLCYGNSATYSITNLPNNAVVKWSINGMGLTSVSETGGTFTATPTYIGGKCTIRAIITTSYGTFEVLPKEVSTNGYQPIGGPDVVDLSHRYEYYTMNASTIQQWNINYDVYQPSYSNPSLLAVQLSKYSPYPMHILCAVTTGCGRFTATKDVQFVGGSPDPNEYSIYPNPTTTSFNIKHNEEEQPMLNTLVGDKGNNDNLSIVIYNDQSQLVRQQKVYLNQSINIDNLRDGLYIIHINDGKKIHREKLIIRRNQ